MAFDDLWNQLLVKKPLLSEEGSTVSITSANLKTLLAQFYDRGVEAGILQQQFNSLFGDLFKQNRG